jgi:hypothetical protein
MRNRWVEWWRRWSIRFALRKRIVSLWYGKSYTVICVSGLFLAQFSDKLLYWSASHVCAVCTSPYRLCSVQHWKCKKREIGNMQQKMARIYMRALELEAHTCMSTSNWLLEQSVFSVTHGERFVTLECTTECAGPRATTSPPCHTQRAEHSSEDGYSTHVKGKCFLNVGGLVSLHVIWFG